MGLIKDSSSDNKSHPNKLFQVYFVINSFADYSLILYLYLYLGV